MTTWRKGSLDDLCDEVAGVGEVGHDGHAHAQREHVGVLLQQGLHDGLGVGVVGAGEVGDVRLLEALTGVLGEVVVVVEDAAWPGGRVQADTGECRRV